MNESVIGSLWTIGWFFTIGYAKLVWWRAAIAVVIWPYYHRSGSKTKRKQR